MYTHYYLRSLIFLKILLLIFFWNDFLENIINTTTNPSIKIYTDKWQSGSEDDDDSDDDDRAKFQRSVSELETSWPFKFSLGLWWSEESCMFISWWSKEKEKSSSNCFEDCPLSWDATSRSSVAQSEDGPISSMGSRGGCIVGLSNSGRCRKGGDIFGKWMFGSSSCLQEDDFPMYMRIWSKTASFLGWVFEAEGLSNALW